MNAPTCAAMMIAVGLTSGWSACGHEKPTTARPREHSTEGTRKVPGAMIEQRLTLDQVAARLWGAGKDARFAPTTVQERAVAEVFVRAAFDPVRGARVDHAVLARQASEANLSFEKWSVEGQSYLVLLEAPGAVRGTGAYVFRAGRAPMGPAVILHAPHAFFDLGTGEIAARLFFQHPRGREVVGFFTNTIHRHQGENGRRVRSASSPADVCHNPHHLFSVVTEATAFVRAIDVVQVHGFGADQGDRGFDAVVSAGDPAGSTARSQAVARVLRARFGAGVKTFPEQVSRLGATTNVQGRVLAHHRGCNFVHVELSGELRKRLMSSAEDREALAAAVLARP
jgi:hypothetical protein